ncbi:hypothetical protein [Streptomyces sp. NPDC056817]|uniref:hypothetical protein n=1 Tax=Streptomyces sp. NPDC056817 TaxID=3345950 RepID=UPI003681FE90
MLLYITSLEDRVRGWSLTWQRLAKELTGALRDVLRIATSRGHLLVGGEPHRS